MITTNKTRLGSHKAIFATWIYLHPLNVKNNYSTTGSLPIRPSSSRHLTSSIRHETVNLKFAFVMRIVSFAPVQFCYTSSFYRAVRIVQTKELVKKEAFRHHQRIINCEQEKDHASLYKAKSNHTNQFSSTLVQSSGTVMEHQPCIIITQRTRNNQP